MDNTISIATHASATATHPSKDKMPNLDGVRAIACLSVIMAHLPLPWGFTLIGSMGVGIFFVLSGFLMGYLYAETAWNTQSIVKYSIARFSRIAPIYWVVLLVYIILTKTDGHNFPLAIEGVTSITRHVLFSGNVGILWSIPLEVQYYVFFIFVWWGLANKLKVPYALPLLISICTAIMLIQPYWPNLTVPSKLHFFLAGTVAGMAPRRAWTSTRDSLALNVLQVGALLMLAFPFLMFRNVPGFYDYIPLAFAYSVAIYLLSISSGWTNIVFANPVIRKIGQASFSIYLIHLLVLHYGALLLGLQHNVLEPMWLLLAVLGVIIPTIISTYVEMPLQSLTRNLLNNILLKRFEKPKTASPTSSETALNNS